MNEKEKDVVQRDQEELDQLDQDIQRARQHLKEQLHEGEPHFIDEGSDDVGDVDDDIAP